MTDDLCCGDDECWMTCVGVLSLIGSFWGIQVRVFLLKLTSIYLVVYIATTSQIEAESSRERSDAFNTKTIYFRYRAKVDAVSIECIIQS